jgi:thymidine kinase
MSDFTLIYGCMFSGKTTRMIELYNESEVEYGEKIAVKPLIDTRYDSHRINSHNGLQLPGHRISKAEEIFPLCHDQIKEVFIDEIQFFGKNITDTIIGLTIQGIKVVAAGLDLDFEGNSFGEMQRLIQIANTKIRLEAKCNVCGKGATRTFRKGESTEIYEARCLEHWEEGN